MDRMVELKQRTAFLTKELEDMTALVDGEKRSATDQEQARADEIIKEMDSIDAEMDNLELRARIDETLKKSKREPVKPDVKRVSPDSRREFRSFGEQLHAVIAAGSPGGMLDARLNRAAGLSEGVPSDGGFLVQTDFAAELIKRTYETGQVVSRARRIPISGTANGLKLNAVKESSRAHGSRWGGIRGFWQAEASTKADSKPSFREMELSLKKLVGLCYATDELLQDAAALESVIMQGFSEEFGFLLDDALINGTGAGMPLGIMNSGCLVTQTRNTASHVYSEDVIGMWARGWARSRPGMVWFINQEVEPELFKMNLAGGTVGSGVVLTYMPPGGLSQAPYGTLFGRPVLPIEQCQALGTTGDIILADFGEYILIDKGGIQSASSIHVRFQYDETTFRSTKQAAYSSDAIMKQPPKRGNLNSNESMAIPCQYRDEMSWVVRRDDTEAAYLN